MSLRRAVIFRCRHAAPQRCHLRLASTTAPSASPEDEALRLKFAQLTDLADSGIGGRPVFATDEWFATADNLLNPKPPTFDPDAFCEQGKVMDGWETRRRRLPGHDWCLLRLGLPGHVHGLEVDTAFFTGNQVPAVRVWGADLTGVVDQGEAAWLGEGARDSLGVQGTASTQAQVDVAAAACAAVPGGWTELVPMTRLRPGYGGDTGASIHRLAVGPEGRARRLTHLRVDAHPDGGIARLRAYGLASCDFARVLDPAVVGAIDLLSALHGARALGCSDSHYGDPRNLLRPGRGANMGEGWETARNPRRPPVMERDEEGFVRMPGVCDWAVLRLGAVAESLEELRIDTAHFRGNYPESVTVEGLCEPAAPSGEVLASSAWRPLLKRTRLGPDAEHSFKAGEAFDGKGFGPVTHLRVSIYPDGGIMRVRAIGKAKEPMPMVED